MLYNNTNEYKTMEEEFLSFEKVLAYKMNEKHLSYEEALEDIISSSATTNAGVNGALGVLLIWQQHRTPKKHNIYIKCFPRHTKYL